jgi:hypothetical protein
MDDNNSDDDSIAFCHMLLIDPVLLFLLAFCCRVNNQMFLTLQLRRPTTTKYVNENGISALFLVYVH